MMQMLVTLLGRNTAWRLGRALYMAARGEGVNDMAANGERLLVERVADMCAKRGGTAVFVDCGANLGDWTAMAQSALARTGTPAVHHLLEPSPATQKALGERFGALANVHIHPFALSDHDGEARFHLVSPTGGTNSLVANEAAAETITVRTVRGENFMPSAAISHVDCLKIDTEGHDVSVIEGLGGLLEQQAISVIQFEYNHRWLASRRSMLDIFTLADRFGYRVGRADGRNIDLYDRWNAENDRFFEWNYVLLTPSAAAALGARETRWGPSNTLIPA